MFTLSSVIRMGIVLNRGIRKIDFPLFVSEVPCSIYTEDLLAMFDSETVGVVFDLHDMIVDIEPMFMPSKHASKEQVEVQQYRASSLECSKLDAGTASLGDIFEWIRSFMKLARSYGFNMTEDLTDQEEIFESLPVGALQVMHEHIREVRKALDHLERLTYEFRKHPEHPTVGI